MGARAAVMSITPDTGRLVLVSYPLHTATEVRDQILLELPSSVKVIFVIGSRDSMCDLARLEEVRKKLKCKTWLVVVEHADHGMNVKPAKATEEVGKKTGEVVAMWINDSDEDKREGRIKWDQGESKPLWSGWSTTTYDPTPASEAKMDQPKKPATKKSRSPPPAGKEVPSKPNRKGRVVAADGEGQGIATRIRKRRKS